ncbi:MAG: STAS domain-containing protein [Elusimicrobia bacterium]|nr:STAS domain-containing protein [Elusimicrobiota bacterium]
MKPFHSQSVFHPKLWTTLQAYSWSAFAADAAAGVIVGIVALPLAIAFGIASGVTPDRGLVTGIVAGFLISALGGSRVQIGGPTGAFVVIVYQIVQQYGVGGLTAATFAAGGILIAMGVFRLGAAIKFIPYPLTVGFTAGIAVVIFSSQVKDLLGLKTGPLPADFIDKWREYFAHLGSADPATVALSLVSLGIITGWQKISRRVPGPFVAIVAVTALVQAAGIPVETIGSRFGELPAGLPRPALPSLSLSEWARLIRPAFTIALLGAIESLLSATVADSMIGSRHRSNTELIGQGIANLGSALFGGIPATGAIARTATNVKNGARTPVAGMIHALTLLLIVLLFGRFATLIPLCVLAAILTVVSYHMSEWHAFVALFKAPRSDVAVLVITFALTVLADLTVAVEAGMVLAMALFFKRMTEVSMIEQLQAEAARGESGSDEPAKALPEGVSVYEAHGALVFGVVEGLRDVTAFGAKAPKVLILGMRDVLALDATAIRAISDLAAACRRQGTRFVLAGVHSQPRRAIERAGLVEQLGKDNVLAGDVQHVLSRLGS